MELTDHSLFEQRIADWFPLLPRTRPPCRSLRNRIDEISELACLASDGVIEEGISLAAEALNKAALVASDCGLVTLAQQLCWRQFDILYAAAPLTARAAKLALQPVVNLGRLLTRDGQGLRAYTIVQSAYDAMKSAEPVVIDGKLINFGHLVDGIESRHELRRFLWTVLLADGTRALTSGGRWADALRHAEQYNLIGDTILDGRQVAILARFHIGDVDGAIELVNNTVAAAPWEQALTSCLRVLCLRLDNRPAATAADVMASQYLQSDATCEAPLFRTRLGLCILDLTGGNTPARAAVASQISHGAIASADGYVAREVMSHATCRLSMLDSEKTILAQIVESSGLHCGTMPAELLDDLMSSVRVSEALLKQFLDVNEK